MFLEIIDFYNRVNCNCSRFIFSEKLDMSHVTPARQCEMSEHF